MLDSGMEPVGVIFPPSLLVTAEPWNFPHLQPVNLREDFVEWLCVNVGEGLTLPVIGVSCYKDWFWYDDRKSKSDVESWKWKEHGFIIVFMNPRKAVMAKLAWGGRRNDDTDT